MNDNSKVILPLDTDTTERALELAALLQNEVYAYKVGLELINVAGLTIFDQIRAAAGQDARIFYDCKLHDIPNTVSGATRAASARGIWMLNVHASGGAAMMRSAVQAAHDSARPAGCTAPLVIAVTLLTSIDSAAFAEELCHAGDMTEYVVRLTELARSAGCDGVVASPHEVQAIRHACGPDFCLVVPGVRPTGSALGDQKRVMTPGDAVDAGADYLVIGRPITGAADPVSAAQLVNAEVVAIRNIR